MRKQRIKIVLFVTFDNRLYVVKLVYDFSVRTVDVL